MKNLKTAKEKAAEWNVSPRYVQTLCRENKIEGAVKYAGAWFIPNEAANPVKKTKQNGKHLKFSGTKNKIFEKAVELFSEKSYESVTIKDIAAAVGIKQSAVYNHFKSKQEILDSIYDFFCRYFTADRPEVKDLEPVLKRGNLLDIINFITYEFHEDYQTLMINITKIIFNRKFVDERAREIVQMYILRGGIEFVENVFNKAIEAGRIAPMATHEMAVFCNSVRVFLFYNVALNPSPENNEKLLDVEQKLFGHAAKLLTDLNPPVNDGILN